MIPMATDLLTAFTLGLLGSGHCFAMCGGIAGALSMRAAGHGGATLRSAAVAMPLYSIGRIGSYALLGATAGAIGSVATELIPSALAVLRTLAGVLLVLMGIYLAGLWNGLRALERVGGTLFARVRPLAAGLDGPLEPLALGAVWGLLPCGLVYGALAWTLAHASMVQGAMLMTAFGLGTLPAVLIAGFASLPLGRALRQPLVRRGAGALLVAFGLWTLAFSGPASSGGEHGSHGSAAAASETRVTVPHGSHADHGGGS
jgi:sulfite exporter TauE/SafE